jgi:hypothetical protein
MLHTTNYATIKLVMPRGKSNTTTPHTEGYTARHTVNFAQTKTEEWAINNTHENI